MKNKAVATFLAAALLATAPARAWVAAGGYHGAVAVGYHPPCCYHAGYSGAAVAGAAVAGVMVGAAVASAAKPAPAPVYYAAPVAYAPAVGTVVVALPPTGCASVAVNGVSYMSCTGVYYQPYYSGGTLMYQVVVP
jgi:hypothetical protein